MLYPVHVEVCISNDSVLNENDANEFVKSHIASTCPLLKEGIIHHDNNEEPGRSIDFIKICDLNPNETISFWQANLLIHSYRIIDAEPEKDFLDGDEEVFTSEQWELPNRIIEGLWDSIIVENSIKKRLLGYCNTSMAFADAGIDPNIISCNRMALLYGPPGTGKTSLCKALAQKAYIRSTGLKYTSGILLEINSHSLFSKWFSESGKLVMKMFDHITELTEDEECFVCILIDEVESLTASRTSAASGNEPGDAVRVVNAVLTSLDTLRRCSNVLVLCTSNMVDNIDAAFKDRVDIMILIEEPGREARAAILQSCLEELINKGVIQSSPSSSSSTMSSSPSQSGTMSMNDDPEQIQLWEKILTLSEGMSGRGLRKLALRAHAFYLQTPVVSLQDFLGAICETLLADNAAKKEIHNKSKKEGLENGNSNGFGDELSC